MEKRNIYVLQIGRAQIVESIHRAKSEAMIEVSIPRSIATPPKNSTTPPNRRKPPEPHALHPFGAFGRLPIASLRMRAATLG
jgi:hypothetical protein